MHYQLELRTSDASQVEALLPFASNIEVRRELSGAHTLKLEYPIGQSGWDYVEPNKVVHVVDASRAVRDEITGSDPPQNDVYVAKELWGAQGDYTVFDVHRVLSSTTGGNTDTTLNDTTQSWTPNLYRRGEVEILTCTAQGQKRTVHSNTGTQLVVNAPWDVIPATSDSYTVRQRKYVKVPISDGWFGGQVLRYVDPGGGYSYVQLTLDRMPATPEQYASLELLSHQAFRIISVEVRRRGGVPIALVECEHLSYDLNGEFVFDSQGRGKIDYTTGIAPLTVLETVLANSTWRLGWNELLDTDVRPIQFSYASVREALLSVARTWECEVLFREDGSVDFLRAAGGHSGFTAAFGDTLPQGVTRKVDNRKAKDLNFAFGAASEWLDAAVRFEDAVNSPMTENTLTLNQAGNATRYRVGDVIAIFFSAEGENAYHKSVTSYSKSLKRLSVSGTPLVASTYIGGWVVFSSGECEGLMRVIRDNAADSVDLFRDLDFDPTGGTCYVYPRAYVGAVLTDVNTTTEVLTFQWWDGGLPVIPYDPGIVKPLVSLMGDLTVGKHPKYRDRVSGTEHNDSGATTDGDVHGITDSTKNWTSSGYGTGFWQGAVITINGETREVASNTSNQLVFRTPLSSSPPLGSTYTLSQKKLVQVRDGAMFQVGDFVFIGLTDMRTGEVRQVVGKDNSGSYTNLFLHDDLSQEPSRDDHVELLTVMGANPSSQLKRGKFIDHDQKNPYLLYQDALRDLEQHGLGEVLYRQVPVRNLFEEDRRWYADMDLELGDTIRVTDPGLNIEGAPVRIKGISFRPDNLYATTLDLDNLAIGEDNPLVQAHQERRVSLRMASHASRNLPPCVHWDVDAGVCSLRNKTLSTMEGLLCHDPERSNLDGRLLANGTPISVQDCPGFQTYYAQQQPSEHDTQTGTVSGVSNASWDTTHRFGVDVDFRVTQQSQAIVLEVYDESYSSVDDLSYADARIQVDGNGKIVPYTTSKETGCYVQVRRVSGPFSLKVTAMASLHGYKVGS